MPFTTLETTNFPLYAVNVLDREHFLIAGGGGAAKTGVPNALVCIKFVFTVCPNILLFVAYRIVYNLPLFDNFLFSKLCTLLEWPYYF